MTAPTQEAKLLADRFIGDGSHLFVHDGKGRGAYKSRGELAEIIDRETNLPALLESHARLVEALTRVKKWFNRLEDGTEDDDPLRALRQKYHAPVHAVIDEALAKAKEIGK